MPPVHVSETDTGWSEFPTPITLAFFVPILLVMIIVFGVGYGPKPGTKLCSNKLHEEWLGKPPNSFIGFVHPPPGKEIRDVFDIRRCSHPKFCKECVAFAERTLSNQNAPQDSNQDDTGPGSSGVNEEVAFQEDPLITTQLPQHSTIDVEISGSSSGTKGKWTSLRNTISKLPTFLISTASHTQSISSPYQCPHLHSETHSPSTQFPSAPKGWLEIGDSNYRTYLRPTIISAGDNPLITMSATIYCDGKWKVQIFGRDLQESEKEHLKHIPTNLRRNDILLLLNTLSTSNACIGIPDTRNMALVSDEGKVGASIMLFYDNVVYQGTVVTRTLRSTTCLGIIPSGNATCVNCRSKRANLRARIAMDKARNSGNKDHTTSSSRRSFSSIKKRSELVKRCQSLARANKLLNQKVARQVLQLQKATETDGVDLGSSMSRCFETIMDDSKDAIETMYPQGTFGRLFWDQQKDAARARGARGHRWHPMLIKWCLNLKMVSGKAYNTMRSVLKLPCLTTLRDYTHWTTPRSGITLPSLHQLLNEIKMEEREPHQKYVVLVHDEMKVKSELVYQKSTGRLVGFVNLGQFQDKLRSFQNEINERSAPEHSIARHMFVIMVRGLFYNFTYPLAYFPTANTTADEIFGLVWDSISILELAGFKVVAVSCDGAATNRTCYDLHGPKPTPLASNKPIFKTPMVYDPTDDYAREVFLLQDPPHLLKCTRNAWANSFAHAKTRTLWNGSFISWTSIEDLYKEDVKMDGLYLNKKLSYEHVNLTSFSKMKVNMAAQILSTTVADSLELYHGPAVKDTVEFVRMFDKFFDLLNIRSRREYYVKRKDNLKQYEDADDPRLKWLESDFTEYLDTWRSRVDTERSQLPRVEKNKMLIPTETLSGLYRTALGFPQLARYLLNQPGVEFILSERINQDPLESFFGNQRQMRGGNEAPSVAQMGASVNAARVKSSLKLKNFGGNTKQFVIDVTIDDTPLPKRRKLSKN